MEQFSAQEGIKTNSREQIKTYVKEKLETKTFEDEKHMRVSVRNIIDDYYSKRR